MKDDDQLLPLTYVDLRNGYLESLAPNHFLFSSFGEVKPFGNIMDDPEVLELELKRGQLITPIFWKCFIAEYLPAISMWTKQFGRVDPIREGDVVTINTRIMTVGLNNKCTTIQEWIVRTS